MDYEEFVRSVDCNVPYGDPSNVLRLIDVAHAHSVAASYYILYELAFPPRGEEENFSKILDYIDYWKNKSDHRLADEMARTARAALLDEKLQTSLLLGLLVQLESDKQSHAAIHILPFAAKDFDRIDRAVEECLARIRSGHVYD